MKKYIILVAMATAMIGLPLSAANLKNISLEYCDTTGNILNYEVDPGVSQDICYTLTNDSDQPITMKINFIDGTYTNDQRQNRACLDETSKDNFGQYMSNYQETVILTGGESKVQRAKLLYPLGSDGSYHGCVSYSVVETANTTTQENSNFSILMRKAKFIDVLVGHPENLTGGIAFKDAHGAATLSPNSKIRIYQDSNDNKYVIELTIQNVGSIEENVAITGVISNIFNYKYTFVENRTLLKGQEFIITKKLEDMPTYYFDVNIQLAYTPVISGRPDIVPQTSYTQETARVYIRDAMTIITIIGLIILLLIIILLFKKSKKNKPICGTPTIVPPVSSGQPVPSSPITQ